ncbi:hypothetical protein [Syntrophomonas erecta]
MKRRTESQGERYFSIIGRCDKETLLAYHYTPDCMHNLNRYMVNHSNFVIAVWDGSFGRTAGTIRYARQKGKKVIIINPVTFKVRRSAPVKH